MNTVPTEPILASYNEDFLGSDEGRSLRILAEYIQPLRAFQREHIHDTIVFFGSARLQEGSQLGRYYKEAQELARLVTEWSLSLPCEAWRFIVCTGAAVESWKPRTGERLRRVDALSDRTLGCRTSSGRILISRRSSASSFIVFLRASYGSRTLHARWWRFPVVLERLMSCVRF